MSDEPDRVRKVHESATVIDGMSNAGLTRDYFERIRAGGISATMVPVSMSDPFRITVEKLLDLHELVEENEDLVLIVRDVGDIHRAKSEQKLGLVLALEDSRPLDKDLRKVKLFHDLGVRRMQLVYTTVNDAGAGAADRVDPGLSKFGVALIGEMERQGMLLDLCHAGPATLADAVESAAKPAVWSHANVAAIYDHPNNLSDEQLHAVAVNGGVVGISGVPFYAGGPDATLDDVIDHVDHVRDTIGIDHVGIGLAIFENHPLEFYEPLRKALPAEIYGEPPWSWPEGIATISEFPNITAKLLERGYTEDEVGQVMGGNYLRVLEAAWST